MKVLFENLIFALFEDIQFPVFKGNLKEISHFLEGNFGKNQKRRKKGFGKWKNTSFQ